MANLRMSISMDRSESEYDTLQTFYADDKISFHKVVKRNTSYSNLLYLLKKYRFDNPKLAHKVLKEGLVMMSINSSFITPFEDVYLDFQETHFSLCVVSDFHSRTITQAITKDTTDKQLRIWIKEICKGISEIHFAKKCHADVNLDNIYVDSADHIKLGPFGFHNLFGQTEWTERMDLKDLGNILLQLVERFKNQNPELASNTPLFKDVSALASKLMDDDVTQRPSVETVLSSLPSDSPTLRDSGMFSLTTPVGQISDVTCRQIALNEMETAKQVWAAAMEYDPRFVFTIPKLEKRTKHLRGTAGSLNIETHIRERHARWGLFKEDRMIGVAFWSDLDTKNRPPILTIIKGTLMLKDAKLMRAKDLVWLVKAVKLPQSCYVLHEIVIHPEFQCQGHGFTLLEPMIDWSIHAKKPIATFVFSERNLNFFTKLGFEIVTKQSKTRDDETLTLWYMLRPWDKPKPTRAQPPVAYVKNNNNVGTSEVKKISNIEIHTKIGTGNFGEVYKGVWQGTTPVALKRLRESHLMDEFLEEAKILQQLEMPNILRFFGMYTDAEGYNYMVTEFMSRGNLRDFLDSNEWKLSEFELLMICKDAAAGMKFMSSKGFVHRDLAARNLLVREEDERYTVKIADFGLAKLIETNYYAKNSTALPVRWCAPEVLMKYKFSVKSDVWAFGVVVWEIFEFGKVPYFAMPNSEVGGFISSGQRLSKPARCPEDLYALLLKCWTGDPESRPNFDEIYDFLDEMTKRSVVEVQPEPILEVPRLRAPTIHHTTYKAVVSTDNLFANTETRGEPSKEISHSETYNNNNNNQGAQK